MHRLISLPISHYVEKARWALDCAGVPYREERYMPLFSTVAVAVAVRGRGGASDRVSTRFSSPVLLHDDGRILRSSGEIARFACETGRLDWYDDPEAEELEVRYHDRLGPHTRRVAYALDFEDPAVLIDLARRNVSERQARWFTRAYPLIQRVINRSLEVEARQARSMDFARREFDDAAERLADGRPYLLGDRFSAADLTFACMCVPALLPTRAEGFGADLPDLSTLPADAQQIVGEFRAHPAGQFVLSLFASDRGGGRIRG